MGVSNARTQKKEDGCEESRSEKAESSASPQDDCQESCSEAQSASPQDGCQESRSEAEASPRAQIVFCF